MSPCHDLDTCLRVVIYRYFNFITWLWELCCFEFLFLFSMIESLYRSSQFIVSLRLPSNFYSIGESNLLLTQTKIFEKFQQSILMLWCWYFLFLSVVIFFRYCFIYICYHLLFLSLLVIHRVFDGLTLCVYWTKYFAF